MQLTAHFRLAEFITSGVALRVGIDNTPPPDAIAHLYRLARDVLEPLRAHTGPIVVTSGFRSAALNRRVGGAPTSHHLEGRAADIQVPTMTPLQVAQLVVQLKLPYRQVIHEYGEWTHVSIALGDRAPIQDILTIDHRGTRSGLWTARS